ncbi:MAG: PepSY domain-containing protein [Vallitaleaceae bacterium]|nr:PepSY domain-containing protein [Vallitaleaceae bacterium]
MKAKLNKTWVGVTTVIFTMAIGLGFFFNAPVNSFTMDVNPSIEILSNRLEKVVEIKPLNEDAEALLLNYTLKEKDLEKVVDDLVDLMILTGYISGGQDNKVTITVTDEQSQKKYVDKVNQMISAYLENKQIEALVLTRTVASASADAVINKSDLNDSNKAILAKTDDQKTSVVENVIVANVDAVTGATQNKEDNNKSSSEQNKVDSTAEVTEKITTKETTVLSDARQVIGVEAAQKIALGLVNGEIKKIEFDDDDHDLKYEIELIFEGREYEIEIDAYTGKVLEFEKDDDDDDDEYDSSISRDVIGVEAAKKIALGLANGEIVKFEFDDDDDDAEYEIEIRFEGREYEIEIDAYTGKVLEFEKDDDENDDDDDDNDDNDDDDDN